MQYLLIANPGVAPIDALTTFGVSLSRYSDLPLTIGEKGSGSKHASILCLRNAVNPIIYSGTVGLEYYSKPQVVGDRTFNFVYYRVKGRLPGGGTVNREERTSFSLEFGVFDWTQLAMGLREFVANALDAALAHCYEACGENADVVGTTFIKEVDIRVVDASQVRAKDGYTRVYIPLTPEVQQFYQELGKRFLHFSEPSLLRQKVLPKANRNLHGGHSAVVYKKGVLIREIRGYNQLPSLFDYNLGDELRLDESRNVDDYVATEAVCSALKSADPRTLSRIFSAMADGEPAWELSLNGMQTYYFSDGQKEEQRAAWEKALTLAAGPEAVLVPDNPLVIAAVRSKGRTPVVARDGSWRKAAEALGMETDLTVLSEDDRNGTTYEDAPEWLANLHDRVWATIVDLGLDNGKPRPGIRCFAELVTGQGVRTAFYDRATQTCNFNREVIGDNERTIINVIEEIGHHCSGESDFTRGFQDWCLRLDAALMKRCWMM